MNIILCIFPLLWSPFIVIVIRTLSNENNKSVFLFWQYWTLLLLPIILLYALIFVKQRRK